MFRMEYEVAFVITDSSATQTEMQSRMEMAEGSNNAKNNNYHHCNNNVGGLQPGLHLQHQPQLSGLRSRCGPRSCQYGRLPGQGIREDTEQRNASVQRGDYLHSMMHRLTEQINLVNL